MFVDAPPPAQESRSAVVCVRAEGRRPLEFSGKLIAKRPGYKPPPGTEFTVPLGPNVQCNNLLRSKVADWSLSVTTSGFTPCRLAAPEFGYRVTYTAKAGARGLSCAQTARAPIGTWK
jgi:hypothetical protein